MQRNYLTISVLVTILGVAFIFLPATYTINLAPEEVTLWEDTAKAQLGSGGAYFSFNTGEQVVSSGVYPYVKVWSLEDVSLSTTFILTGTGGEEEFTMTENPSEYALSGGGTFSVQITGTVVENQEIEVNAGFYYLRPLEPEQITYYPYRYFGYGMLAIGVIASLLIYIRLKE